MDEKPIKLNSKEIKELEEEFIQKHYKKNEVIFFEGEKGEGLFLIEKGKVKLVKMSEGGEELTLNIYRDNEIFAEIVIFDHGPYPATAITMEKSKINKIDIKDLNSFIAKHPDISTKIMKIITKRLRRAQQNVQNLGLKNSKNRLAALLNYLAERHGIKENNKTKINMSLTQQEIANMIGTTRETVSRAINLFKRKGYIETNKNNIYISNLSNLKNEM